MANGADRVPFLARIPEIAVGALMAALLVWNANTIQNMQVAVTRVEGTIKLVEERQANAVARNLQAIDELERAYAEHEANLQAIWPRLRELQDHLDRVGDKVGVDLEWRHN